jgi:hypothetical protein
MRISQIWGRNILAVVLMGVPSTALADAITFNTSDSPFAPGIPNQGWWSATQPNNTDNVSYFVGWSPEIVFMGEIVSPANLTRNFFSFDLTPLVPGSVISAQLEVARLGYESPNPSETLGLWNVSTNPAILNNNSSASPAIFNDLGSGTSYGSFPLAAWGDSDAEQAVRAIFPLNANAIADINSAAGGFFSIGGALQNVTMGSTNQGLFGFHGFFQDFQSLGGANQILRVETVGPVQPVPEPSTVLLLASGLAALVGFRATGSSKKG